jgi:hypothetical protein
LSSIASSAGIRVDLTPPQIIYVNDGLTVGIDVEAQTVTNGIFGNWRAIDEESGIGGNTYISSFVD